MLLGAVDLGSNSFRVEIGRVDGDRILTQSYWKETIRLAAGFDETGAITPEMQKRALEALARFHERLAGLPPAQVRAVGTQAHREATKSAEFLAKAETTLGYPIGILSGHEEARLVFKGCARTLPPSSKKRLVVDIGGATTEFVIGQDLTAQAYESFHVGCVNTSIKFFQDGNLTPEKFDKAVVACAADFSEVEQTFGQHQFDEAYGSAGTFGAVSDICVQLGWSDGEVKLDHLERLRAYLLQARNINNIEFPGLKPDRIEVIAGGLAVLIAVYRTLGIRSMRPASGALRVGLLYELLGSVQDRDTRDISVEGLIKTSGISRNQAERVANLSIQFLNILAPDSDPADLKRLRWSALLHEIGTTISTSRYHRHGEYIVSNADMPGFTRTDQKYMASLILAQRGRLSKVSEQLHSSKFAVHVLALRLAVIFAHARKTIQFPLMTVSHGSKNSKNPNTTFIKIEQSWLQEHPLTAYLLQQEIEHWQKVGKTIVLETF